MLNKDEYFYVTTQEGLESCVRFFKDKGSLGFDIEASGLGPKNGHIICYQFGNRYKQFVIHAHSFTREQLQPLFDILEDPDVLIIGHNLKFEFKWMKEHHDVSIINLWDTYVTEGVLFKGDKLHKLALVEVLPQYCRYAPALDKEIRNSFIGQSQAQELSAEQIIYAALDVKYLIDICIGQRKIVKEYKMEDVIQLENDTVVPVSMMEHNGIYIDKAKWLEAEAIAIPAREVAKKELDKFFEDYVPHGSAQIELDLGQGRKINYASPFQLKPALEYVMGYHIPNTQETELERHSHPVIESLLSYREYDKAISTYGSGFLDKNIDPKTGRLYSTFDQLGADSGRLAGREPNLMSIKKEPIYRTPFCTQAPDKRSMISADYSSCELRLIAELSQEPEWLEGFKKGYDMHSYVAAILWDLDYHDITVNNKIKKDFKHFRDNAKNINFGGRIQLRRSKTLQTRGNLN